MKAKISVIIPNYNYGRFIGETIESVLAQTLPPLEIIVVDDGSTDDSVEIIESFGGKVKLIKQQNGGVGKARNTGAFNSKGNFLAFLDADDVWLPDKLAKQITLFESDDEIGLVSCGMREFDVKGNTLSEHITGKRGWCAETLLMIEAAVIGPGSTALVKRTAFEKIGGFDETKEMHPSEDWEFCYRISLFYKLEFTSEILVKYRNHGDNGHLKIPRFERSMTLAFDKTFRNASPKHQSMKNQAYGNLHRILAGSYFQTGDYNKFLKHTIKSFQKSPENILYFLRFPFRRLKKLTD